MCKNRTLRYFVTVDGVTTEARYTNHLITIPTLKAFKKACRKAQAPMYQILERLMANFAKASGIDPVTGKRSYCKHVLEFKQIATRGGIQYARFECSKCHKVISKELNRAWRNNVA